MRNREARSSGFRNITMPLRGDHEAYPYTSCRAGSPPIQCVSTSTSALARDHFAASASTLPVFGGELAGLDVQFLQAGAAAEEGMHVVLETGGVERGIARTPLPSNRTRPASSESSTEKVGALQHDIMIGLLVAVGQPLLLIGALAGTAHVVALAPQRIGVPQPERRRPRAGREVDVKVGSSCRSSIISRRIASVSRT